MLILLIHSRLLHMNFIVSAERLPALLSLYPLTFNTSTILEAALIASLQKFLLDR